jgi:hypothetical protein
MCLAENATSLRKGVAPSKSSVRSCGTVSDFDEFKSYYALAHWLMVGHNARQLADCLRVLALHVADIDYAPGRSRHRISCSDRDDRD